MKLIDKNIYRINRFSISFLQYKRFFYVFPTAVILTDDFYFNVNINFCFYTLQFLFLKKSGEQIKTDI